MTRPGQGKRVQLQLLEPEPAVSEQFPDEHLGLLSGRDDSAVSNLRASAGSRSPKILDQRVRETLHRAQRCAQIVRHGIRESLELLVRLLELFGQRAVAALCCRVAPPLAAMRSRNCAICGGQRTRPAEQTPIGIEGVRVGEAQRADDVLADDHRKREPPCGCRELRSTGLFQTGGPALLLVCEHTAGWAP